MSESAKASEQDIERARELYAVGSDNNIEVDGDAIVSEGDGGVWVQAWVWVPYEDDEEWEEEGEGDED